jgi:hypothetical protein
VLGVVDDVAVSELVGEFVGVAESEARGSSEVEIVPLLVSEGKRV